MTSKEKENTKKQYKKLMSIYEDLFDYMSSVENKEYWLEQYKYVDPATDIDFLNYSLKII